MKSVTEWNSEQLIKGIHMHNQPQPAGVACDVCGNEMLQDTGKVLMSMPPKVFVWCMCGSTAYKVL